MLLPDCPSGLAWLLEDGLAEDGVDVEGVLWVDDWLFVVLVVELLDGTLDWLLLEGELCVA